jgi:hypothetical protein
MNNCLKLAYEAGAQQAKQAKQSADPKLAHAAGAQQALVDAGLAKQAVLLFAPTNEKRLALQLVEGGWGGRLYGRLAQNVGTAAGMGFGALGSGLATLGPAAGLAGTLLGSSGLAVGARRGNRIAGEMLAGRGNHYATSGIPEARRRAVATAVRAESRTRKATRQVVKGALTATGAAAGLYGGAHASVALANPLMVVAGLLAGGYAGQEAAYAMLPVRVAEATRLEKLRGAFSHGLKGPGGKATALAALLGAGALGYNALSDD